MLLLSLHFYPALWILCNESVPYGRESVMTLLPMCASGFFLLSVLTWQQLPKAYGILHHSSLSLCNTPSFSCQRRVWSSIIIVNLNSLFQISGALESLYLQCWATIFSFSKSQQFSINPKISDCLYLFLSNLMFPIVSLTVLVASSFPDKPSVLGTLLRMKEGVLQQVCHGGAGVLHGEMHAKDSDRFVKDLVACEPFSLLRNYII